MNMSKISILLFILITAGAMLPACNVLFDQNQRNDLENIPIGESFELSEGQQAVLVDGTRINFDELVSDGRCPLDAFCIWEGALEASFSVEVETKKNQLIFSGYVAYDGGNGIELQVDEQKTLVLERMDPFPGATTGKEIQPVATLRLLHVID